LTFLIVSLVLFDYLLIDLFIGAKIG